MSHNSERESETHMGSDGLQNPALDTHRAVEGVVMKDPGPSFLLFPLFSAGSCLYARSIFCVSYCRCTEVLHLPSAARRLFNEKGKEIFSVKDLQRDELVKT